jgi:electron transfer flavoprotein alpha subunit
VLTKPVFGGKAVAELAAVAEPVVATLRRGGVETPEASGASTTVETRPAPNVGGAVELLGREAPKAEGASLEDAKVIVSGGAGLGDGAAFDELEELARLLGGAVGASLAAVDAGWAPPDRQVGLTGKSVAPDVYFALGISGASQHLAGIGDAKAVVAVNTDPDAPIFSGAKLGAVTDCRALVAALTDELRRRSSS